MRFMDMPELLLAFGLCAQASGLSAASRPGVWRGGACGRRGRSSASQLDGGTPPPFPVVMAVGMGLLWAQMHGYLHVPVSVCDWVRLGK